MMFNVTVRKRDGILFSGDVRALSGVNAVGPFDILPQHANFVSIVTNGVILHLHTGVQKLTFDRGVMRVSENSVTVFVGI